jgi:hypothetical protein
MRRASGCLLLLLSACAHDPVQPDPVSEPPPCCNERVEATAFPDGEGHDFAARVEAPARCEAAARARLAVAPDEAWRGLWDCVLKGRFTALRPLLRDGWDHELKTRADAPLLMARVIAERGGDVETDLSMIHELRVPLFSLSQALARPDLYRGALVIVRARLSSRGVLSETRLVSQSWDLPVGATERVVTRAAAPFASDTRRFYTSRRSYNLDVATGARALAAVAQDPFIDDEESLVVLGRFEGLRDADGWPLVTVLQHFRPKSLVSY